MRKVLFVCFGVVFFMEVGDCLGCFCGGVGVVVIITVIPSGLKQIPLGIKNLVHALIHIVIQCAF